MSNRTGLALRPSGSTLILVFAFVVLLVPGASDARPALSAPALPPPLGPVVNVSNEAELQAAVAAVSSNVTIVLAPGVYHLTRTLYFNGSFTDIGIRGGTGNADDVVLVGPGMTRTDYGEVPHGMWTGNGVDGITIANLTIREVYYHPIIFNAGTQRPHVYNVHLIDAGQQFIKSNPAGNGVGAGNGIVEYSTFEFTTTARDYYSNGVDIIGAANWIIRDNLFRNLQAPPGQLLGPSVLAWRGSSNTITERNTFVNCARGIAYGLDDETGNAHAGGAVRNNFFYRSSSQGGDTGIYIADSPGTQVVNNTVVLSGTYGAAIEYRYPGTTGATIANNLVDGTIWARDGATATLVANVTNATADLFDNPATGDLHLRSTATVAIDQGVALSDAATDWDGELRPNGGGYDIGADEYRAVVTAYRIGGRVTSTATGAGVAGVTVTLTGTRSQVVTTDQNGDYLFPDLPVGGDYTVTPGLDGFTFAPELYSYYSLATNELAGDFAATPVPVEQPPVNEPPANQPPTVSLIGPASLTVTAGERVTLTAAAADADGGIATVSFYMDQRLIRTDDTSPYSATWKATKQGMFTVVAVATDAMGAMTTSAPIVVTVLPRANR